MWCSTEENECSYFMWSKFCNVTMSQVHMLQKLCCMEFIEYNYFVAKKNVISFISDANSQLDSLFCVGVQKN